MSDETTGWVTHATPIDVDLSRVSMVLTATVDGGTAKFDGRMAGIVMFRLNSSDPLFAGSSASMRRFARMLEEAADFADSHAASRQ